MARLDGGDCIGTRLAHEIDVRRPSLYLQPADFAGFKTEDKLKIDGAAWEIASDPDSHDGLAVLLNAGERLDCVLIFLLGFRLPCRDGRQALEGAAFVPDHGIVRKALSQGFHVMSALGGEVGSDGFGKIERQGFSSLFH
jgi:hypothetical protein